MITDKSLEHFCTLFDQNYLPLGMALHQSLINQAQPFHLWVLCMDEAVERSLKRLALPHVSLIPLRTVETPDLLAVKPGRSRGEYCWTLTPFSFQAVFDLAPEITQVTYLDADLFLLDDPRILLQELQASQREVLITDHAYAPQYERTSESGRFCVQFLTFKNTSAAKTVMQWWQARCLEWCFNRLEAGKFGDQMYLDCWPEQFSETVHIVRQRDKTLAPWNVRFVEQQVGTLNPVIYHFHSLRLVAPDRIRLFFRYRIGPQGMEIYRQYVQALTRAIVTLKAHHIPVPYLPLTPEPWEWLRAIKRRLLGEVVYAKVDA